MENCGTTNLYIISFIAGGESGLAMVAATDESSAKQILRNSGGRNCCPDSYTMVQIRNIGMTSSNSYGLLMESYVDSMTAYNAIVSLVDKFLKGEPGNSFIASMYVDENLYIHIVEKEYIVTPLLSYDQNTGYLLIK